MTKWPTVMLGDIADMNPRLRESLAPDQPVSFLGMADASEDGTTTEGVERPFDDVRRGFTPFESGDILVAKITPCFQNGKIVQASTARPYGFGSTEFHVLRSKNDQLDHRYGLHFLRQEWIRIDGERRMTGSGGQRRVPADFLKSLAIPMPSIAEQRRIAAILDHADALRAKRRDALTRFDELTQSIFTDMFDDGRGDDGSPVRKLGDVALQVTDGEHQTPKRASAGILLLSARNVQHGTLDLTDVDYVGEAEYERISRRCNPTAGDILISCSGSIGRVAVVPDMAPFSLVRSVALVRFSSEWVLPEFAMHYLRTPRMQAMMQQRANASSQANLFQGPIRELPMLVPPIATQRAFVERVGQIEMVQSAHRAALAELDALFASLQSRAFRGEL
ncbi:restriction endonuclease subunit S [Rhodococcus sp. BE178]|uniref:restriction endonuclease subunit S n=1 Tax=Rhodococcus sp. BE178 TaxID=2817737 RepID=UPI003D20E13A